MQTMSGLELHGVRWSRKAPALNGGGEVTIDEDYWFCKELSIFMIVRRNDPREGEQVLRVVDLNRAEPLPEAFKIPTHYKVVNIAMTGPYQ